jgi:hypothetical protein
VPRLVGGRRLGPTPDAARRHHAGRERDRHDRHSGRDDENRKIAKGQGLIHGPLVADSVAPSSPR